MPVIQCPMTDCPYATEDVDVAIAAALLVIHNNVHIAAPPTAVCSSKQRAPKIERPKISSGSSEETWNSFAIRWSMFTSGTMLTDAEKVQHLFQCCDEDLGDAILKGHSSAVSGTEQALLAVMKQMAVIPVAICVRRAEFLATKQDHGEKVRIFFARVKGKAATCAYIVTCSSEICTQVIDFTDIMVKDVLIAGLVDEEIRKEVLGWADLDSKSLKETVSFIEAKEMARNALAKQPITAGVSSYKTKAKHETKLKVKVSCKDCSADIERYVWNKRQGKMIECNLCLRCWKKANPRKGKGIKEE